MCVCVCMRVCVSELNICVHMYDVHVCMSIYVCAYNVLSI